MRKRIAVLGITGSIGKSTIEIVKYHPESFEIVFATAHRDYEGLYSIAKELNINKIAIANEFMRFNHNDELINFYQGQDEIIKLIKNENYDILINAVSGSAGLPYTIATLEANKNLALANKESLVMAGHLINELLSKSASKIIPVDSEHSAIFQVLQGHSNEEVKLLHITASGGSFRQLPLEEFGKITIKQALNHPTWSMGTKVTLDSATMMNKGLEVIEAHWLFNLSYNKIKAVIHPQSVIHSLVEFVDGSILAQMSKPTMELPILFALTYPIHYPSNKIQTSLIELAALTFETIDAAKYPLFYLACQSGEAGGIMPTILNAANEGALELFLKEKISFNDIYKIVDKTLNLYENIAYPDLDTILHFNREVKEMVLNNYL
jgi:1-deoxy-D-xylulose-5-phosphate reductoisomerase